MALLAYCYIIPKPIRRGLKHCRAYEEALGGTGGKRSGKQIMKIKMLPTREILREFRDIFDPERSPSASAPQQIYPAIKHRNMAMSRSPLLAAVQIASRSHIFINQLCCRAFGTGICLMTAHEMDEEEREAFLEAIQAEDCFDLKLPETSPVVTEPDC